MSEPPAKHSSTGRKIVIGLVLVLGTLGVLGYAAQQRMKQKNTDSVVLCNIRQLSAAADQYFLENGVSSARLEDIVGPDKYLRALEKVAGETYPTTYVQGRAIIVTGVAGTRTVTYVP